MTVDIRCGDCLDVLPTFAPDSFHACVTDPPYHLGSIVQRFGADGSAPVRNDDVYKRMARGFMGKTWDGGGVAFDPATWAEVLRVLKPGAHLVAFGGSRTFHRLTCAIEDAGFEIRDCLMWLYGSGFPKSLDVGKQFDKMAGAERERGTRKISADGTVAHNGPNRHEGYVRPFMDDPAWQGLYTSLPVTDEAKAWDGWGSAVKPAWEPVILARKPLSERSLALNVLKHGTGALNVNACRLPVHDSDYARNAPGDRGHGANRTRRMAEFRQTAGRSNDVGRWPANVMLDEGSAAMLDEQSGVLASGANPPARGANTGGASRFFYVAKASRAERGVGNTHPTVKPVALLSWLLQLVTPPDGAVLDPFLGSGSTAVAAIQCGFGLTGIELNPEYVEIIEERLARTTPGLPLHGEEAIS